MSTDLDMCGYRVDVIDYYQNHRTIKVMNASGINHCEKSNCTPYHLCQMHTASLAVLLLGYLSPILVLITIVNNTLVCIVLFKKSMRTPTNRLLVSIAIADSLTGSSAIPIFMRFYITQAYKEYIPYNWCLAIEFVGIHIPTVFHTASIWLTVGLGIQRYIYICHSYFAKQFCTIRNVVRGTVIIFVISTFIHLSRFFEVRFSHVYVISAVDSSTVVDSCLTIQRRWLDNWSFEYFNMYFWIRVVLIHLIPCASLVIVNALLIVALKKARKRRDILLKQNRRSESRRLQDTNTTTTMLLVVVCVFLLVEVPLGVVVMLYLIQNSFSINIFSPDSFSNFMVVINFLILVSYPFNFFIYCGISRQFRSHFKSLFVKSIVEENDGYISLHTENIKSRLITEETNF